MKSFGLLVLGACSLLLVPTAASAATMHGKRIVASAKKPRAAAKVDRKAHAAKRAPQHDAQLDYPQLG
ncbi:MAG TPA: hypothetical protein VG496_17220 [Myxococcales bacterium]|nr:hypothetical protein [Myxococcales bacterium]